MSVIAYDLGTGGIKASLVSNEGKIIRSVFEPYETFYCEDFQDQRPEDWWNAIITSTHSLVKDNDRDEIVALSISGHSLGVVPIGQSGELLRDKTPIWSDKRANRQAEEYFSRTDYEDWYMKTGAGFPAACYSVFKIMWYRDNEPEMFSKIRKVIGTKDYCNFRFTGKIVTDPSYASGCGIFNLKKWGYDNDLLEPSGLPIELFPEIIPSDAIVGEVSKEAADATGLKEGIKVIAGGVDNSCMALGARGVDEGRVYTSLGSSAWIALISREPVLDFKYKPYVFAHLIPGMYTSATSIFSAGTSFAWSKNTLFEGMSYDDLNSLACESPRGANGILFNPSLAGGSMLDPTPEMTGAYFGLKLGHSKADVVRSTMEGIALNLRVALDVLTSFGTKIDKMLMVGGGAKSIVWMQMFADIYNLTIEKTNIDQEAATLGAAALALKGSGIWNDYNQIDNLYETESILHPDSPEFYDKILPKFKKLIELIAELNTSF